MKKILFLISVMEVILLFSGIPAVLAYTIEDLSGIGVEKDFVIGPAKKEVWLNPGESTTINLNVTNRLGSEMSFRIGVEDFVGSRDPNQVTVFLGEEKGPYSLKDYLKPEITEFTLKHGQRMVLPIEISIPKDAEAGGLYGAVMVSTFSPATESEAKAEEIKGGVQLASQLASLFLVRVKGEVKEEGFLKTLATDKSNYQKGPISFSLLYENTGDVHLIPYGIIEIKNILGRKVDELEITPYFAMPNSVRLKEIEWDKGFLFGKYTALASLNRGYQNIIDQKSVTFWVLPWKILLAGFGGLFLIIWLLYWIATHLEIKRRTTPPGPLKI